MKVYELMSRLEKFPSGAEVHFSAAKTQTEIDSSGVMGTDENGEDTYLISGEILDIDMDDSRVYLMS